MQNVTPRKRSSLLEAASRYLSTETNLTPEARKTAPIPEINCDSLDVLDGGRTDDGCNIKDVAYGFSRDRKKLAWIAYMDRSIRGLKKLAEYDDVELYAYGTNDYGDMVNALSLAYTERSASVKSAASKIASALTKFRSVCACSLPKCLIDKYNIRESTSRDTEDDGEDACSEYGSSVCGSQSADDIFEIPQTRMDETVTVGLPRKPRRLGAVTSAPPLTTSDALVTETASSDQAVSPPTVTPLIPERESPPPSCTQLMPLEEPSLIISIPDTTVSQSDAAIEGVDETDGTRPSDLHSEASQRLLALFEIYQPEDVISACTEYIKRHGPNSSAPTIKEPGLYNLHGAIEETLGWNNNGFTDDRDAAEPAITEGDDSEWDSRPMPEPCASETPQSIPDTHTPVTDPIDVDLIDASLHTPPPPQYQSDPTGEIVMRQLEEATIELKQLVNSLPTATRNVCDVCTEIINTMPDPIITSGSSVIGPFPVADSYASVYYDCNFIASLATVGAHFTQRTGIMGDMSQYVNTVATFLSSHSRPK